MTNVTLITGTALIALGVVTYPVTGFSSVTALAPAAIGLVMLVCGLIARRASAHQHAIHAALVVALAGAVASIQPLGGLPDGDGAAIESLLTILVCLAYLALGVRSFVAARRARQGADG
ncbi:MAG: hypothetical protein BRC31_01520 [Actinobacteria bacterium QS_5_72_10]|nr:MAG: hypothetical protein BRC31_01520 [Actinobacteria bacterium QS_5_72_10]